MYEWRVQMITREIDFEKFVKSLVLCPLNKDGMIPIYDGMDQQDIDVDYTFLHSAEFPEDPKVEHVSNEAGSWDLVETAAISSYWYTVKGGMELLIKKMNGRFEVTKTNKINCSIVAMMREAGYLGGINRAEYVSLVCQNGHSQEVDGLEVNITNGLPCPQCLADLGLPLVKVADTKTTAVMMVKVAKWWKNLGQPYFPVDVFLSRITGYRMRNPDDAAEFEKIESLAKGLKAFGIPVDELARFTIDDLLAQQSAGNAIFNFIFETLYREKFEDASQDSLALWAFSESRPLAEALRISAAYDLAVIQGKLWKIPVWTKGIPQLLQPKNPSS